MGQGRQGQSETPLPWADYGCWVLTNDPLSRCQPSSTRCYYLFCTNSPTAKYLRIPSKIRSAAGTWRRGMAPQEQGEACLACPWSPSRHRFPRGPVITCSSGRGHHSRVCGGWTGGCMDALGAEESLPRYLHSSRSHVCCPVPARFCPRPTGHKALPPSELNGDRTSRRVATARRLNHCQMMAV